jgi:hypothetical protein
MTERENKLLDQFLDKYVEPVEHNRKFVSTTMHSIYGSLQRIFLKSGKIDLKWDDVCVLFEQKGYRFTDAKMRYVEDTKAFYVSPNGDHNTLASVGERGNHSKMSHYFYVNISPIRLSELRKSTKGMPPNVGIDKLSLRISDNMELEDFFKV